jgi:hypothetical protein
MLTDIDKGVGRIKDQAFTMNDEIKLQNKILTLSYDNVILKNDEMLRNYRINETSIINCSY